MLAESNSRRLTWRRSLIVLAGLATLVIVHPWLLASAYGMLEVNQPESDCRMVMVVTPSPGCFEAAAEAIADGSAEQILIIAKKPSRREFIGAVEPLASLWRSQLISLGVSDGQIRVISTDATTPHEAFSKMDPVLQRETEGNCAVISTSTLSRYHRMVIDQVLSDQRAIRYSVRSIHPKASDPSNWWRSRSDVTRVFDHGLRTLFVACVGESTVNRHDPYEHLYQHLASQ